MMKRKIQRMGILAQQALLLCIVFLSRSSSCYDLSSPSSSQQQSPPVFLPTSQSAMIKQAASAISTALLQDKINLQTIRLPLSEAMYSDQEEGFVADRAIGWQGGPQETYRFLSPIVRQVLQSTNTLQWLHQQDSASSFASGLVPKINEQILLDFDGSALLTTECPAGPLGDAQALLQPNTDSYYPNTIKTIEAQLPAAFSSSSKGTGSEAANEDNNKRMMKINRLFLLVNPAWRDASSFGFFSAKQAQKDILDRYETTYAVDQFVVRGQKCSVLKVWPHDWCVFGSNLPYDNGNKNDENSSTFLGSFKERPPYKVMDELVGQALKKKKR